MLNGIYWRLRTGSPWADIPERYGPATTCYNRFVRWRRLGVWDRIFEAVTAAYDGDLQMIDQLLDSAFTSTGRTQKKGVRRPPPGTSLTPDAWGALAGWADHQDPTAPLVDGNGLPVALKLTPRPSP